MPRCSAGPSPRIFIYDIPRSLLSRPTPWRLVYDVGAWIRKSPHWERHGDCADYFFVPMHPENMVNGRMTGDASFARLYAYIRETWPYWNRTVDAGTARHFHLLPCDHGPGDCGYGQLDKNTARTLPNPKTAQAKTVRILPSPSPNPGPSPNPNPNPNPRPAADPQQVVAGRALSSRAEPAQSREQLPQPERRQLHPQDVGRHVGAAQPGQPLASRLLPRLPLS